MGRTILFRSGPVLSKSSLTVSSSSPPDLTCISRLFAADDLSLNVSRETLQQGKFLKQIKQIIQKRLLQLLTKLAEEDPEKFAKIYEVYGTVIKLGAVESAASREKLTALARFSSTQRDKISLDEVRI